MEFTSYKCNCSETALSATRFSQNYSRETFQCVIVNYIVYLKSRNMGRPDIFKQLHYLSSFHYDEFIIGIVHSRDNILFDCSNNVKMYLSIQAERGLSGAMIKHLDIHCMQEFVQFIDNHNPGTIDEKTREQLKASNEYIELLAPKRF